MVTDGILNISYRSRLFFPVVIALTYFAAAKLGLLLASLNHNSSPFWPASGVAICGLFLYKKSAWPAIFFGAFAANFLAGGPFLVNIAIACGNTLEAVAGAVLLNALVSRRKQMPFQFEAIASLLTSVLPATISAAVGNMALVGFNVISWKEFLPSLGTWWVGDFIGALFIVPSAIVVKERREDSKPIAIKSNRIWRVFSILLAVGLSVIIFQSSQYAVLGFSLLFTLLPVAFKTDRVGTIIVSQLIASIGIYYTVSGKGPFTNGSFNENIIHLQLFLAAVLISAIMLPDLFKSSSRWISLTALITGWLVASIISMSIEQGEFEKDSIRFSHLVDESATTLSERLADYEDALQAGASLFAASDYVSSKEWQAFSDSLQVVKKHPGINGVGVIFAVKHSDLESFESKVRDLEFPNFKVRIPSIPQPSNEISHFSEHFVITYIEPRLPNLAALGLDVASELHRREGALYSRDTGKLTATKAIVLVQDKKKNGQAFCFIFRFTRKT